MNTTSVATTTELLNGLHQPANGAAWDEFDRRYRPILVGFLQRSGLNETDAADVAQETLACFVRDYRRGMYDRRQGRLRSWLIGIARCRLADLRRAAARRSVVRGESAMAGLADEADADALWEAEQRRVIFQQALVELRQTARFSARTLEAFERVVLRQEPIAAVSAEMGFTPQEIYNVKNRIVERLREIVKRYADGFAGG